MKFITTLKLGYRSYYWENSIFILPALSFTRCPLFFRPDLEDNQIEFVVSLHLLLIDVRSTITSPTSAVQFRRSLIHFLGSLSK